VYIDLIALFYYWYHITIIIIRTTLWKGSYTKKNSNSNTSNI